MNNHQPRFTHAAQQGERGVNLVASIFFDDFGWIFKRNHQEHDFGIDGQVEVVTNDGGLTGQILAVQIKFGKSFFQEKSQLGYVYRGEAKHFNYLSNYPIAVVIVICHPDTKQCYWVKFDPLHTHPAGENWKITIPFANDLSKSQTSIQALLPEVTDQRGELEGYWKLNNILADTGYIHFIIDRPEILSKDTERPRSFFDRLRVTKELALACQGKVEISFYGYDSDTRELFEIPEVREYMPVLSAALPELFYFARTQKPTHAIQAIALCQTQVEWTDGRSTKSVTKQVVYDTPKVARFMMQGYAGLNEITDWLALPLEENKRICRAIGKCLGIDPPPDEDNSADSSANGA